MSKDQELIAKYLASGGTIKRCEEVLPVCEPYKGKLTPSQSKIKYDRNGNRIYQHLNKLCLNNSVDESSLNYGR